MNAISLDLDLLNEAPSSAEAASSSVGSDVKVNALQLTFQLYMKGMSVQEISQIANVDESVINGYLQKEWMRKQVSAAAVETGMEAIEQALVGGAMDAVMVMRRALTSPNENVRCQAAKDILDRVIGKNGVRLEKKVGNLDPVAEYNKLEGEVRNLRQKLKLQ